MILYKILIVLDDNEPVILQRSDSSIIEFFKNVRRSSFFSSVTDEGQTRTQTIIQSYETSLVTNVPVCLSIEDLSFILNEFSVVPSIITSSEFQIFVNEGNSLLSTTKLDFFDDILRPSPINLLLQPLDTTLLYIPRRQKEYIDISLKNGQTLLWKFRVENNITIDFGVLVYTCNDNSSNEESDSNRLKQIIQTILSNFVEKTSGLKDIDLGHEVISYDVGSIQVLEPLIRVKGSHSISISTAIRGSFSTTLNQETEPTVNAMESSILSLQSSSQTSDGYIEGSYHASSSRSEHVLHTCRLVFDNTFSKIRGKHVEYIVQVVDDQVMKSAVDAANEIANKLGQPQAKAYSSIVNSTSVKFIVDGPWDFHPRKNYPENNLDDDSSVDGRPILPTWLSTLGSIPIAGPLVVSVTDKVAHIIQKDRPVINKVVTTVGGYLPESLRKKLTLISTPTTTTAVSFDDAFISSIPNPPIETTSETIEEIRSESKATNEEAVLEESAKQRNGIETLNEELVVKNSAEGELQQHEVTDDDFKESYSIELDDIQVESRHEFHEDSTHSNGEGTLKELSDAILLEMPFLKDQNKELLRVIENLRLELEDYKRFCNDMRRQKSHLQTQYHHEMFQSKQQYMQLSDRIASYKLQIEDSNNTNQKLRDQIQKIKAERKILKQELLNMRKMGLYGENLSLYSDNNSHKTTSALDNCIERPIKTQGDSNEDKELSVEKSSDGEEVDGENSSSRISIGTDKSEIHDHSAILNSSDRLHQRINITVIPDEEATLVTDEIRSEYSMIIQKLRNCRQQGKALKDLLSSDPENETIQSMLKDVNSMLLSYQQSLSDLLKR